MTRVDDDALGYASVAEALRDAAARAVAIPPVRTALPTGSVDAAYVVQEINTKHRLRSGQRAVGLKVGLTSVAVQRQLGVDQPDFGVLFADVAMASGSSIELRELIQPRVEAEIALILDRDLTEGALTTSDMTRAVAYALPALEIVDSRIARWDIDIVDTIADNASSGRFVLGTVPRKLIGLDLASCSMQLSVGGTAIQQGIGSACLGNPLNAAVWLATTMAERGRALRAGDVILTGALGPMVDARVGARFEATIGGLGSVDVAFHRGG